MRKYYLTNSILITGLILSTVCGCRNESASTEGVLLNMTGIRALPSILSLPDRAQVPVTMKSSGIARLNGGLHLKIMKSGKSNILLPLPQLVDTQVPICFFINSVPEGAIQECRILQRDSSNTVLSIILTGSKNQEIRLNWSAAVLTTDKTVSGNPSDPAEYTTASPCVQSGDKDITALTGMLWPQSGKVAEYARNIQDYIRNMKQKEPVKTLDAAAILKSGGNWICTANANLAAALMRARGIPCRSIAVIPTNSMRLEMHRIVEYCWDGKWIQFDPSLVYADIPLKPYQNIIISKTSMSDESISMKPRMAAMPGAPYAQEAEILCRSITFWGNDFFWSTGAPISEFEVSEETARLTIDEWTRFLKDGSVSDAQIKAVSAKNLTEYIAAFQQ